MDGIQLIKLLDVLQVDDFDNAVGVVPRSLSVRGQGFENVDTVLINGTNSPSFMVYSKTGLVAQVPSDLDDAIITEVTVLSAVPTFTARSVIELTVGTRVKRATGAQRLMQTFIRLLLRTTGSNIFHKTSGGSMTRRIGANITERLAADISVAVATTRQYIIAQQTPESQLPPSERLMSAEIAGLEADVNNASVYVTVILTTQSGQRSGATLVA
jgi:hypothetical protein